MESYLEYLKNVEQKADNTLVAYKKDLTTFAQFLENRNGKSLVECADSDATAYMLELTKENKSKATLNRKLCSLKAFYEYKVKTGEMAENPWAELKPAGSEVRAIDYLELYEVEALINQPDDSLKGMRDRALIEFMYGTGVRVTELVRMKIKDVNLRMRFVSVRATDESVRILPLGSYAYEALRNYMEKALSKIIGRELSSDDYLFVNMQGAHFSRQGVWKLLKDYGGQVGIGERMTPQILRDTFAVHLLKNGADMKTLKELMGLDDMSAGLAYLECLEIHIKEVFNRTHPRA